MSEINLKPCPFCGSEAKIWHCNRFIEKMVIAFCINCKAHSFAFYDEAKAVKAWNRRSRRKNKGALFQICPFCGSDRAGFEGFGGLYHVKCVQCYAATGIYTPPGEAIEIWNTRAGKPEENQHA